FDSLQGESGKWVMVFNEYNTHQFQTYAAVSSDLENWEPYNQGKPILTANDFNNISWAGKSEDGQTPQSAMVSDVIRHQGKWYLFMDGYDEKGKQHIGLAI